MSPIQVLIQWEGGSLDTLNRPLSSRGTIGDWANERGVIFASSYQRKDAIDIARPNTPKGRTVDQMAAYFLAGIAHAPGHNRIYLTGDLVKKWGKPEDRKPDSCNSRFETWNFRCRDGVCSLGFWVVGYSNLSGSSGNKADYLRMEIKQVKIFRE
jgi:hypothetical protein